MYEQQNVQEKNEKKSEKGTSIIVILIIIIILLLLFCIYMTQAYLNKNSQEVSTNETIEQKSSFAIIINRDSEEETINGKTVVTRTFEITNNGTLESTISVNLHELIGAYNTESITYTLSYAKNENDSYTNLVTDKNIQTTSQTYLENLTIPADQTYYYELKVTLDN